MTFKREDLFAGRKRRRGMDKRARQDAKKLLAGDPDAVELKDARAMFAFHYGLKEKYIDALMIGDGIRERKEVLLTFKDLPRGVPNVLGAPGSPKTDAEADFEARRLLAAAWVAIQDTKALMRSGQIDDLRMFRYQELMLRVPGEWVDKAASKIPENTSEEDRKRIRKDNLRKIQKALGSAKLTPERWNSLSEDTQIEAMIAASALLCVEINHAG